MINDPVVVQLGYKYIFLNEAGIILKNRELYTNTVLPMMLDFPDSKLIAAGVPKGKFLKDGTEHPFYTLAKKAMEGNNRYQFMQLSTYDNPLLSQDDIKELELEIALMSKTAVDQEIYGEFMEVDAVNPFAYNFSVLHHLGPVQYDPNKRVYLATDFNLNPFACTFRHIFQNAAGIHVHVFHEFSIENGSIDAMAKRLKQFLGPRLVNTLVTGDALGKNRNITQADNSSNYQMLAKLTGIPEVNFHVRNNPTHDRSRNDVNMMLGLSQLENSGVSYKINPENCPNLVSDYKTVQCDAFGQILKKDRKKLDQRADFLDTDRYAVHHWIAPEIERMIPATLRKKII